MSDIFEGFSISHAAILGEEGLDDLSWGDLYGVREGSLEADIDNYDNTGDDSVLSTWYWYNFANLTIKGGYVPFRTIAGLTGATLTSSGTGDNIHYELPLWEQRSLNQPTRSVLIRVPSKDSSGAIRNFDFVLYKVQFQPISFEGPTYKDGLVLNYSGKALISDTDHLGNALTGDDRAIGRLINRPA